MCDGVVVVCDGFGDVVFRVQWCTCDVCDGVVVVCDGCGNQKAFAVRRAAGKESRWTCNFCDEIFTLPASYDVFFDGASNPNLCDNLGNPVEFVSKGHKARWMREHRVQEAGDLVHGARYSPLGEKGNGRRDCKEEVREAVRQAKETISRRP